MQLGCIMGPNFFLARKHSDNIYALTTNSEWGNYESLLEPSKSNSAKIARRFEASCMCSANLGQKKKTHGELCKATEICWA